VTGIDPVATEAGAWFRNPKDFHRVTSSATRPVLKWAFIDDCNRLAHHSSAVSFHGISSSTRSREEGEQLTPTSSLLENLVADMPNNTTLECLLHHLNRRSFGIVLLLLGIIGLLPAVSPVAGIMLTIPAYQMIRAHSAPVFPRGRAQRTLPTDKLTRSVLRITPALRYLERFVKPRWTTPFETTKRIVGVVVLLLGVGLLAPFPLSNIPVALTIILVAFAYLEEDGVLLAMGLVIAFLLFGVGGTALWRAVIGAASFLQ
jgi:hypothetical protein